MVRSFAKNSVPSKDRKILSTAESDQAKTVNIEGEVSQLHQCDQTSLQREENLDHYGQSPSQSELEHTADLGRDWEYSSLAFIPETSAEDHFLSQRKTMAYGTFSPVGTTFLDTDDGEWDLNASFATEEQKLRETRDLSTDETATDETSEFVISGPLPSLAVRGHEAIAIRTAIGGDAANLSLRDTMAVVRTAGELHIPVVLAGEGILDSNKRLSASEYAVSTLGSRSAAGNFVHALVISPVLSIDEILSSEKGSAWLASIIRKEQLLVSYRPIRGASSCEDLSHRAKSMPTTAESIISRQRGLGTFPMPK